MNSSAFTLPEKLHFWSTVVDFSWRIAKCSWSSGVDWGVAANGCTNGWKYQQIIWIRMQESIFFKISRVRSCLNGLKLYNFKNLSFTKVEIYNLTWGFASVWLRRRHCYCTLGFLKYFFYEFRMVFIVVAFFVFDEEWTMENQVRCRNHAWGEGNNQWHKRERKMYELYNYSVYQL